MRDLIRMTPAEVRSFLEGQRTLVVATIGRTGVPHLAPMWFALPDGDIAFCTDRKSQKVVNLRRDPRCSVLAEAGETYDQLRGVHMEGVAEFTPDLGRVVDAVVARNFGEVGADETAREALRKAMSRRVAVLFRPVRTASWDHRKTMSGATP
ncbi:PPOX class probable F420-dependent enzyme [Lentzea xinjiangensis]|uniref:PPOX class probable F420-dependent enzyme n=1 Tax=Lentzea xinjiangensis TaxID=402600 RepID=A0A1H9VR10_9PSEU|nr:TIGR03618 family F420-dependent PPOX class oxidoreductase [Lentzea xinjiangensis]SES24206.1 PPOX class probable F420-dependent enzyme [Lentzea xinjiangensis]